jgi:hypothetical protein
MTELSSHESLSQQYTLTERLYTTELSSDESLSKTVN